MEVKKFEILHCSFHFESKTVQTPKNDDVQHIWKKSVLYKHFRHNEIFKMSWNSSTQFFIKDQWKNLHLIYSI